MTSEPGAALRAVIGPAPVERLKHPGGTCPGTVGTTGPDPRPGQGSDSGGSDAAGVTRVTLLVPEMTCRHCVRTVTAALRDVPGVELVQADVRTTTVVLFGEPAVTDVLAALKAAGFKGTVVPSASEEGEQGGRRR